LDYIAPLDDLPFEDSSFEAVLCTQVLEHLERPGKAVKELYRVLKPGGKLFLTAPMAHKEHQVPYDFYRYTSFGLKSICKNAGFSEITITPFGGMFTRWAYEFPKMLSVFPGIGIKTGKLQFKGIIFLPVKVICLFIVRIIQISFLFIDRFDKTKDYPFGWSLIAQK